MIHVSKIKACVKKQKGGGNEPINNEIKPNIIRDRGVLKLTNILKVITKLAMNQGYDEYGRILGRNGKYIDNTDIIPLIACNVTRKNSFWGK